MVVTKLCAVGDSLGFIIERPILEQLNITVDTALEVTTDGEVLVIRPMRKAPLMDRAHTAADKLLDVHADTYRKLAE